jgi:hypothetical protein
MLIKKNKKSNGKDKFFVDFATFEGLASPSKSTSVLDYWSQIPRARALSFEPFYWFVSNRTSVTLLSGAESLKENKKEKGKQLTQN